MLKIQIKIQKTLWEIDKDLKLKYKKLKNQKNNNKKIIIIRQIQKIKLCH
jgi:hypothetical protein